LDLTCFQDDLRGRRRSSSRSAAPIVDLLKSCWVSFPESLTNDHFHPEPGGYIQWDEGNPTTLKWGTLNPSTPTPAFTLLTTQMRAFSNHVGLIFTWIPELPNLLKAAGIKDAKSKSLPIPKSLLKPWTDQMLMALEELSYSAVDKAGLNGVAGYGSGNEMRALLKRCYAESREIGAFMNNDHMVVWGRKPGDI